MSEKEDYDFMSNNKKEFIEKIDLQVE